LFPTINTLTQVDPENLKLRESMLLPVMVQAIKDLSVEVESLKLQVEALTNK
jgi:hypothetical protein